MSIDRLTAALADRYRIERELGQGGMATVYLAQDRKHLRPLHQSVDSTGVTDTQRTPCRHRGSRISCRNGHQRTPIDRRPQTRAHGRRRLGVWQVRALRPPLTWVHQELVDSAGHSASPPPASAGFLMHAACGKWVVELSWSVAAIPDTKAKRRGRIRDHAV
jgi:serine/threonine protein kinase